MDREVATVALEKLLATYTTNYSLYNADPLAWELLHGSWEEFEHLEKSRVLFEMGRIMELLHLITKHNTGGDVEYYSTARSALQILRQFLEKHVQT